MIRKARELSTFLRLKVDYLLPKHCLLCLSTGNKSTLCERCKRDFPAAKEGCVICGEALPGSVKNSCCGLCLSQRPAYNSCRSAFDYAFPVRQMILRLKYHEQGYWAAPLADSAWPAFQTTYGLMNQAVLIPVPMHKSQFRQRRDNHAELIARRLSAWSGFRVDNKLIIKQQQTTRQAELSGKARRRNLKHAFALQNKRQIPDSPLIVIDDVATTGTTINSIARLIRTHSDVDVFGFTIAKRSLTD